MAREDLADDAPWREQFIRLTQAFYRHAGTELPYFDWDGSSPIAFDVAVDAVKMVVGCDPGARGHAHLFVYCVLGPIPQPPDAQVLLRLLTQNLSLARECNGTYCLDPATHEVAVYLRCDLERTDVAALNEQLMQIAQTTERWRAGESWDSWNAPKDSSAEAGPLPAAWAVRA